MTDGENSSEKYDLTPAEEKDRILPQDMTKF
jgi:hypothetical protein